MDLTENSPLVAYDAMGERNNGAGMTVRFRTWACVVALIAGSKATQAQPAFHLETQAFVERVTTDINGRSRRTLANTSRATPGDQLIVTVHWRNEGRDPVRDFTITRPVPHGTQIDAANSAMQVSVDGGVHWGRLSDSWRPTPLGGTRRAVPADITHIRWMLPQVVPPGQAGRLSYRATVQ